MSENIIIDNMRNQNTHSTRAQAMYKRDLFKQVDEQLLVIEQLRADRALLWVLAIFLTGLIGLIVAFPQSSAQNQPVLSKSELSKDDLRVMQVVSDRRVK